MQRSPSGDFEFNCAKLREIVEQCNGEGTSFEDTLGHIIWQHRDRVTQKGLARKLNIAESTVSTWTTGGGLPRTKTVDDIVQALLDLMGESGNNEKRRAFTARLRNALLCDRCREMYAESCHEGRTIFEDNAF
jgi:predicted transcriptional regulator